MKKGLKRAIGIIAVAVIGFSATGCVTATGAQTRFPAVSDYTFIPSKDYVVVGTVVLRNARQDSLIADLMDLAIEMGGHDVINIRVDWRDVAGRREISTATAVVIRFTEETVVDETTITVVTADGVTHTTTQRRPVRRDETVTDTPPANAGGGSRIGGRRH